MAAATLGGHSEVAAATSGSTVWSATHQFRSNFYSFILIFFKKKKNNMM